MGDRLGTPRAVGFLQLFEIFESLRSDQSEYDTDMVDKSSTFGYFITELTMCISFKNSNSI